MVKSLAGAPYFLVRALTFLALGVMLSGSSLTIV
jgi:hypothetical protein